MAALVRPSRRSGAYRRYRTSGPRTSLERSEPRLAATLRLRDGAPGAGHGQGGGDHGGQPHRGRSSLGGDLKRAGFTRRFSARSCVRGSAESRLISAPDAASSRRVWSRRRRFDHVYAADLVRFADPPPGVKWSTADLNEPLPLAPASVDLLVAIEVVEHLENVRAVCREWARLVRPGGAVVITTPNNESLRAILSLFFRGHFIAFVGGDLPGSHNGARPSRHRARLCRSRS